MTAPRFNCGDRVRVVRTHSHPQLIGEITTISSEAITTPSGVHYYRVLFPPETGVEYALEECLAPVYDGDQAGDWADCVWQPKALRPRTLAALVEQIEGGRARG